MTPCDWKLIPVFSLIYQAGAHRSPGRYSGTSLLVDRGVTVGEHAQLAAENAENHPFFSSLDNGEWAVEFQRKFASFEAHDSPITHQASATSQPRVIPELISADDSSKKSNWTSRGILNGTETVFQGTEKPKVLVQVPPKVLVQVRPKANFVETPQSTLRMAQPPPEEGAPVMEKEQTEMLEMKQSIKEQSAEEHAMVEMEQSVKDPEPLAKRRKRTAMIEKINKVDRHQAREQEPHLEGFAQGYADNADDDDKMQTSMLTMNWATWVFFALALLVSSFMSKVSYAMLEELVNSIWLVRWGVLCSWIFLVQTAVAFLMACAGSQGEVPNSLALMFNVIYSVTYSSFLVAYLFTREQPAWSFMIGVALYTLGYFSSTLMCAFAFTSDDMAVKIKMSRWLYVACAINFFAGSAFLIIATIPPTFSPWDKAASLFWGSVMFLAGSMFFTLDSLWDFAFLASKPKDLGFYCAALGLAFFSPGRVFFLWGSTTDECGFAFRGTSAPAALQPKPESRRRQSGFFVDPEVK